MQKNFKDLSERESLALAISLEEEDIRTYSDKLRAQVELMEAESKRFYQTAARHLRDAAIRQLLGDLAAEKRRHEARAEELEPEYVPAEVEKKEDESHLSAALQVGLGGMLVLVTGVLIGSS
jgi:rubrerythrin